jgi:hypothetical protein
VIVDFILYVLFTPFIAVLSLIPSFTMPSVLGSGVASSAGSVGTVGQAAYFVGSKLTLMGSWVNIPIMISCMSAVALAWVFHIAVRVLRLVLSLVTGGGGGT